MSIVYIPESGRSRFCVYHLVNPILRQPFYIGSTNDPWDRWKGHRKGNLTTAEGRARHAVITALFAAQLPLIMEIHRTFPYRGRAMKHESATIKELLEGGAPILNYSKLNLEARLGIHLHAIAGHVAAQGNAA